MSGSHGIGSKQQSSSSSSNSTTNIDERMAIQDGFGLNGSTIFGGVKFNSTDAVQAIAEAGLGTVQSVSGAALGSVVAGAGAVTDLTGWAIDRNLNSLENLTNRSTELVDSLIDKSYGYSREAQEQATWTITRANDSAIAQITAANSLAAGQVRAANDAATRTTTDTLAGARAVIGAQSDQIGALAKSTQALGASLSQAAVAAYQPGENKALDSIKTMGIAAAVVAGLFVLLRASK